MRVCTALLAIGFVLGATSVAAEYREITVTDGAVIEGRVVAAGDLPVLPPQPVFKQKEICGAELPDERLLVGKSGELRNAVVYLTDIKAGKAARLDRPVKLDNHRCAFVPHVLSATFGQTLEIHNSDPFLHDAHAALGSRTIFNIAVLKDRVVRQPILDTGLMHINCNVRHTWMHAYLYVAEHPYHAVTDAQGRFVLDDVPPGIWTVRVWHELLGSTDLRVKVGAGETKTHTITLQAHAGGE